MLSLAREFRDGSGRLKYNFYTFFYIELKKILKKLFGPRRGCALLDAPLNNTPSATQKMDTSTCHLNGRFGGEFDVFGVNIEIIVTQHSNFDRENVR